jgi:hypothetical protein
MADKQGYSELNGQTLATYTICYELKCEAESFAGLHLNSKQEVSPKRFELFHQQNNLIFVDMLFPNILADIALEVYMQKVNTLANYLLLPKTYQIVNEELDAKFLNEKIRKFVEYILYSDINQNKQSAGTLNYAQHYSYTNTKNEIWFFSELNKSELIELALSAMVISIDQENSLLNGSELKLCVCIGF